MQIFAETNKKQTQKFARSTVQLPRARVYGGVLRRRRPSAIIGTTADGQKIQKTHHSLVVEWFASTSGPTTK